ncbi:MAG: hypothetical protein NXH85_11865 [Pseudomonadaceae bacterium]|nr:hypothetical protein [Pseudomonadaceae bacterium]
MVRSLAVLSACAVSMFVGVSATACDADARDRAASAILALPGGSSLDMAQLQMALDELCNARTTAAVNAEKADQLQWRPVAGSPSEAPLDQAEEGGDDEDGDAETTTILGMEFRKADSDSEGRRRLMKKR